MLLSVGQDAAGWTVIDPSPDSRLVYVSSSQGSDSNTGLTPDSPLQSLAKAESLLRKGSPDWLLLKRGDTWLEGLGRWVWSGRSEQEPAVISSYGDPAAPRPLLKTANGITMMGGFGTPATIDHVAIIGLHFYASSRDPQSPDFVGTAGGTGLSYLRPGTDLLIEDNVFDSYKDNLAIQGEGAGLTNLRIRRNVIVDAYSVDAHSQGIYLDNTHGTLLEGNVFDHNGWNSQLPGAEPTIFNHDLYVQYTNSDISVLGNLFANASSHGAQVRPGGIVKGNLFVGDPIALFVGTGSGEVCGNVFLQSGDISPTLPRGFGIDVNAVSSLSIFDNVLAHDASAQPYGHAISLNGSSNVRIDRNVIYDWRGGIQTNNATGTLLGTNQIGSSYAYPDPSRTLASYNASLGGPASLAAFLAQARQQSRQNWHIAYTAPAAVRYIREGFGLTGDAGVSITPVDIVNTTEAGGTAAYQVVLTGQPISNVTIPLSSSNTAEGTLSTDALTFTPDNWNVPQTITVTGVDDFVDDGDVAYKIIVAPALSTDPNYTGLKADDVALLNIDDDTAGISIIPGPSHQTTESGGTVTFQVVLTSQPLADVTIPLNSSDASEGTVSVPSLIFTPQNWNVPQTVTVTGVDDDLGDGNVAYKATIGPAQSDDPTYKGMNAADITLINLDDDFSYWPDFGTTSAYKPLTSSRWEVATDGRDARYFLNATNYSVRPGNHLGEYSLVNKSTYKDFVMTLSAKSNEDLATNRYADYAVVFGFVDPNNYCYLDINVSKRWTMLYRVVNGVRQDIAAAATAGITDNRYHQIQITRIGTKVTVLRDGVQILSASDSRLGAAGQVGVGSLDDSAYFDDINVSSPRQPASTYVTADPLTAPTNSGSGEISTEPTGDPYYFRVTYIPNAYPWAVSGISNGDTFVVGRNGYKQTATLVAKRRGRVPGSIIATYAIKAPGGTWNSADNSTYTIYLAGNQVMASGRYLPSAKVGRFTVNIPRASARAAAPSVTGLRTGTTASAVPSITAQLFNSKESILKAA